MLGSTEYRCQRPQTPCQSTGELRGRVQDRWKVQTCRVVGSDQGRVESASGGHVAAKGAGGAGGAGVQAATGVQGITDHIFGEMH